MPLRTQRLPPAYIPPLLDKRARIRNPTDRPDVATDRYGRETSATAWGTVVWAGIRDRSPQTSFEEGVEVDIGITVFTIRKRAGVASDVEVVYPSEGGDVYESVGPAVRRGGAGFGRAAEYLEIHTRLRK